ncbi:MAG: acyl carrier protein [Lachnospiraceae bacterium]|nr:acyl carrier protein [Lachnospiraceae bacterium]
MLNDFRVIVKELYGVERVELTSAFKTDFGLTSFDFVNLICLIEEKYDVELEEKKYRSLNTVEDLIQYLETLIAERDA